MSEIFGGLKLVMASNAAQSLALPAIVDLDTLDAFRDKLLDALESGPVSIDSGKVERVATNALVMLLSAAETAKRNESEFSISEPSEAMQAAIDRLGFTEAFAPLSKG